MEYNESQLNIESNKNSNPFSFSNFFGSKDSCGVLQSLTYNNKKSDNPDTLVEGFVFNSLQTLTDNFKSGDINLIKVSESISSIV